MGKFEDKGEKYMKKMLKKSILLLLTCILAVTTVYAEPSADELEDDRDAAQQELESLEAELDEVMAEIYRIDEQMITVGNQITQATTDLANAEKNEEKQYEAMKCRIVAMYENGNTSFLEMVLEAGSIAGMLKSAENVKSLHEYDRKELQRYAETKAKITNLKQSLESEEKQLETLYQKQEEQKQALNEMISQQRSEVADIDAQIQAAEERAAAEAARRAEEEERRRREEEARREQENNNNNNNDNDADQGDATQTPDVPQDDDYTGGDASVGQQIVSNAEQYLGVPYVWGGTSPSGFDCSGLVQYVHREAGISIPRTSYYQRFGGKGVSIENALPGDVVCYNGHVGLYIGGGQMIHAPQTGDVVKVASIYTSQSILAIRRYW